MKSVDNEPYRALVEHAPSLVWRAGTGGQHEYFNATWLAFTGRSLKQEIGTGWVASLHPDDVFACLAVQEDHFARREAFEIEYRLRRHDGVYRRVVDRGRPEPQVQLTLTESDLKNWPTPTRASTSRTRSRAGARCA